MHLLHLLVFLAPFFTEVIPTHSFCTVEFAVHSFCTYIISSRLCSGIPVLFWQSPCCSFWGYSSNHTGGIRWTNWYCLWVCWSHSHCLCIYSSGSSFFSITFSYVRSWMHDCWVLLAIEPLIFNFQVHGARLRGTQEEVVIKVLKPGIEDVLVADLNFVYVVARILEFLSPDLSRASLVWGLSSNENSMLWLAFYSIDRKSLF